MPLPLHLGRVYPLVSESHEATAHTGGAGTGRGKELTLPMETTCRSRHRLLE